MSGFLGSARVKHPFSILSSPPAAALPPQRFEPVGVTLVTGSLSSVGFAEFLEQDLPKDHPLYSLYRSRASTAEPTMNLLFRHGVRSALAYDRSGDVEAARRLSNPDLAPHAAFVDMAGHGYSVERLTSEALECEFVCIPRPVAHAPGADGGPVRYRVVHRVARWRSGASPRLEQHVVEGRPELSV